MAGTVLLSTVIFGLKVVRLLEAGGTVVGLAEVKSGVVLEVLLDDDVNDDVLAAAAAAAAAAKMSVVFKSDELKT